MKAENNNQINGHINRNIRLLVNIGQAASPHIELLGYTKGGAETIDGGASTSFNEMKLYWRVVGCAHRINGFGYKIGSDEKYRYQRSSQNKLICFWEGD